MKGGRASAHGGGDTAPRCAKRSRVQQTPGVAESASTSLPSHVGDFTEFEAVASLSIRAVPASARRKDFARSSLTKDNLLQKRPGVMWNPVLLQDFLAMLTDNKLLPAKEISEETVDAVAVEAHLAQFVEYCMERLVLHIAHPAARRPDLLGMITTLESFRLGTEVQYLGTFLVVQVIHVDGPTTPFFPLLSPSDDTVPLDYQGKQMIMLMLMSICGQRAAAWSGSDMHRLMAAWRHKYRDRAARCVFADQAIRQPPVKTLRLRWPPHVRQFVEADKLLAEQQRAITGRAAELDEKGRWLRQLEFQLKQKQ
ncbi:hypothetical protein WJX72_010927 [[Myrmecia] bisecta]|uniref:Uncharacterized protein n=1 Tax=[Myrmecia] bisecta TaxID=41462 RepID=A0AAW1R925_9CHLO